jgi:ubiquinone/menaquinone biosynthesis C-methylase UbiE
MRRSVVFSEMNAVRSDMSSAFVGSIPEYYDRHLGPVLFEPYAIDLARRLPASARRLLEVAAGTGRVTRHLLAALPADGELVATDLNAAMVEHARGILDDPRVTWRVADAQALPFDASAFDAVICQFGLMFVPDKLLALRELRRVLRPGGVALLSTWNALEHNGATHVAHSVALETFSSDPPLFYLTPFSLPDPLAVRELAIAAGFTDVRFETVPAVATSVSATHLAAGLVRGNPISGQLAERGLDAVAYERRIADTLAVRFGA